MLQIIFVARSHYGQIKKPNIIWQAGCQTQFYLPANVFIFSIVFSVESSGCENISMDRKKKIGQHLMVMCLGSAALHLIESENESNNDGNKKNRKKREIWVNEWVRRRSTEGCCAKLLQELRSETPALYRNFLRMSATDFDLLVCCSDFLSRSIVLSFYC